VATIDIRAGVTTRYEPTPPQPNHDGPPSAWFEGDGLVQIGDNGDAVITAISDHHSPGR
jgi:hypothetical protein